jgi:hypothetical protein
MKRAAGAVVTLLVVAVQAAALAQGAITWTAPSAWVSEKVSSSPMRHAQYRVSGPAGPAECAVFFFGRVDAGDARGNAARWASSFRTADGKVVDDPKVTETRVGDLRVTRVEVTGNYMGSVSGSPTPEKGRPDHELLGAIAQAADGPWFFRIVGPRATVEASRADFDAMIASIAPRP